MTHATSVPTVCAGAGRRANKAFVPERTTSAAERIVASLVRVVKTKSREKLSLAAPVLFRDEFANVGNYFYTIIALSGDFRHCLVQRVHRYRASA